MFASVVLVLGLLGGSVSDFSWVQGLIPDEDFASIGTDSVDTTPIVTDPNDEGGIFYIIDPITGKRVAYRPGTGNDPIATPVFVPSEGVTPTTVAPTTEDSFTPAADARNTIAAVLETYGLGSLSTYLYDVYARQEVNISNPDALLYALRDQPAYQQRFAGNTGRRKKGLAELSPGSYIGLEDAYRRLLQANGLPSGFYDQTEDFQKMIENDTSPQELNDRIQNGFNAVDRANPEVLRQIRLLYPESGIGDSRESLAAFFLDPVKAAPVLARQAKAAQIGAKAYGTGGLQLSALQAEDLARRDFSEGQISQAFSDLNTQAGLLNEMEGEVAFTQAQKLGAVFGYDATTQKAVGRRRDARKAIFSGGGRYTATSGATSGTQESSIGSAQ